MNLARRSGNKAIFEQDGTVKSAIMSIFCGASRGGSRLHPRLERDFFFPENSRKNGSFACSRAALAGPLRSFVWSSALNCLIIFIFLATH